MWNIVKPEKLCSRFWVKPAAVLCTNRLLILSDQVDKLEHGQTRPGHWIGGFWVQQLCWSLLLSKLPSLCWLGECRCDEKWAESRVVHIVSAIRSTSRSDYAECIDALGFGSSKNLWGTLCGWSHAFRGFGWFSFPHGVSSVCKANASRTSTTTWRPRSTRSRLFATALYLFTATYAVEWWGVLWCFTVCFFMFVLTGFDSFDSFELLHVVVNCCVFMFVRSCDVWSFWSWQEWNKSHLCSQACSNVFK